MDLSIPHVCGGEPKYLNNDGWDVFPMYVGVNRDAISERLRRSIPHVCGGEPA